MITTYSLKKHGNEKVSENFRVYEFRCKDGSDEVRISSETVAILQSIRDYFGKSVTINSAYRTPSHNKAIGGAANSQHVKGTACDIKVRDVPPAAVVAYIEDKYPRHGIGFYSSFTHIDSRGFKSYWDQRSGKQLVVSTFGLGKMYERYKSNGDDEEEVIEMTIPEIKKALLADGDFCREVAKKYIDELEKKPVSSWAAEDWKWAEENGITDGDRPQANATRQEVVSLIRRAK